MIIRNDQQFIPPALRNFLIIKFRNIFCNSDNSKLEKVLRKKEQIKFYKVFQIGSLFL